MKAICFVCAKELDIKYKFNKKARGLVLIKPYSYCADHDRFYCNECGEIHDVINAKKGKICVMYIVNELTAPQIRVAKTIGKIMKEAFHGQAN